MRDEVIGRELRVKEMLWNKREVSGGDIYSAWTLERRL